MRRVRLFGLTMVIAMTVGALAGAAVYLGLVMFSDEFTGDAKIDSISTVAVLLAAFVQVSMFAGAVGAVAGFLFGLLPAVAVALFWPSRIDSAHRPHVVLLGAIVLTPLSLSGIWLWVFVLSGEFTVENMPAAYPAVLGALAFAASYAGLWWISVLESRANEREAVT